MNLRFAFAVNNDGILQKKHFGDADKYLIFEQIADKIVLFSEEINKFKFLDDKHEHGSRTKGRAIVNFLKEKNVTVLVSTQFGKNISIINEHFIPVKVALEQPEEIAKVISKHIHWINDEWENKSADFKLFTINSGVMKTSVKNGSKKLKKSVLVNLQ